MPLYIAKKWRSDQVTLMPHRLTGWQTLKDRATWFLRSRSGALFTQSQYRKTNVAGMPEDPKRTQERHCD